MPREVLWFDCNLTASTRMKFQPRSNSKVLLLNLQENKKATTGARSNGRQESRGNLMLPTLASEWLWVVGLSQLPHL